MSVRRDMRTYGWPFRKALIVNFWWRCEHLPCRSGDGGLCGPIKRRAYARRKEAERA
jgi:hypothetical protein